MDNRIREILTGQMQAIRHSSGLMLLLYPMKGFSTVYAAFTTDLGSVDTGFKTQYDKDMVDVPEGVAHFLEHKMFENEDGDAFEKYAKTGASANAFTSFDKTSYLFSCTDRFEESLSILLDFVRRPYFTKESVQKEQGIIGQEIRMYDDSGDWRVMFNLLEAMYQVHPVRIDIAGTIESIAQIDADLLYRCHRTFYNLENMILCVAGNFEPEQVLRVADRVLKPDEKPIEITRKAWDEPREVGKQLVEQKLPVAAPLFEYGFKAVSGSRKENLRNQVLDEILTDIVCGESSPLYRRLYDEGMINSTFDSEVMSGRGYHCILFSGESRKPKEAAKEIAKEVERLRREGIDPELFALCRKAAFGRYIGLYGRPESAAGMMNAVYFAGEDNICMPLETVFSATVSQMEDRLEQALDPQYSALSIIWPVEE